MMSGFNAHESSQQDDDPLISSPVSLNRGDQPPPSSSSPSSSSIPKAELSNLTPTSIHPLDPSVKPSGHTVANEAKDDGTVAPNQAPADDDDDDHGPQQPTTILALVSTLKKLPPPVTTDSVHASPAASYPVDGTPVQAGNIGVGDAEADPGVVAATAQEQAIRVRSNILRAMWYSLSHLWKPRLIFFLVTTTFSLLQIIACITVLSLPSSLGNSPSGGDLDGSLPAAGEQCDPEPIFTYLLLHATRLAVLLPLEIYLALSPHPNARQRRPGARNFEERERRRIFGSLERDRKVAKVSNFLGFIEVILFAVGNWAVWSRTECARPPAESIPLFYTGLSILCIAYLYIAAILFLTVMVVFFLPMLLILMRALGITARFPQPDIQPETGKVEKNEVEKVTRLVYYIDEEEWSRLAKESSPQRSSLGFLGAPTIREGSQTEKEGPQEAGDVIRPPSPLSPSTNDKAEEANTFLMHVLAGTTIPQVDGTAGAGDLTDPDGPVNSATGSDSSSPFVAAGSQGDGPVSQGVGSHLRTRILPYRRLHPTSSDRGTQASTLVSANSKEERRTATVTGPQGRMLKYPLHPLPSHRSTCPICLCDFESPVQRHANTMPSSSSSPSPYPPISQPQQEQAASGTAQSTASEGLPEPLRLLPCQHVLHASCIDEWLTTVSGRCPICQRPVLRTDQDEEADQRLVEEARAAAAGDPVEVAPSEGTGVTSSSAVEGPEVETSESGTNQGEAQRG